MTEPQAKITEPHMEDSAEPTRPGLEFPAGEAAPHEALQAENAQLKDQLLRALAEAENTRRRAQKEREDTSKYAIANFAKEMLGVADNFRRALESLPKDSAVDDSLKNLLAGIEATERQLSASLDRFGIKKIDPKGEAFDPNFHRVMMEVEDPAMKPGTIVQVLQAGYMIHDRLLREALVTVAKGGAPVGTKVDREA